MQYQNLGILQKVKYLNFGINSSYHGCTVMLMKNKQWVLFFTPRAFLWICGGRGKIHFLYWEIVIICLDK